MIYLIIGTNQYATIAIEHNYICLSVLSISSNDQLDKDATFANVEFLMILVAYLTNWFSI